MPKKPFKRGDGVERLDNRNNSSKTKHIDFFRLNSNHAYISNGFVSFNENSENNLAILKDSEENMVDMKNTFLYNSKNSTNAIPIFDMKKILDHTPYDFHSNIKYNKPTRVSKRESLPSYSDDYIKEVLTHNYNIDARNIYPITFGRSNGGKYVIEDSEKNKFILKYKGRLMEDSEEKTKIVSKMNAFFPNQIITNYGDNSIRLGDGIYGLESFVEGNSIKERSLDYTKEMGKKISLFHNSLESLLINSGFSKRKENFNESNLLSLYFDIINNKKSSNVLAGYIKEIIDENLSEQMRLLPASLIHGDLNSSNVLISDEIKFIDYETLGVDYRIKEFTPVLLLDGNMAPPEYISGSLNRMIDNYNKFSNNELSEEEIKTLPLLLQASILKYYTVNNIRKINNSDKNLRNAVKNIEKIKEDANVYKNSI